MAVTSEIRRSGPYVGNNSTVTPYVIGFYFLADSDIVVVVTTTAGVQSTLLLTTDYVVTGAGSEAGGSLVTLVAVPATSTVVIYSRTPITQTTEYVEADEFPAAAHERSLDKSIILIQERRDAYERAFRIKESYPAIAALTPVFNSLLGLNAAGAPVFQTASEVYTWINAVATVLNMPTKTFADAAARAAAVPDFLGQIGSQRDTNVLYLGTALTAGSWAPGVSSVADMAITTAKLADGALSANAAGRLKMAAAYLMATHLNADAVTGQSAATLLEDGAHLLGTTAAGVLSKFPGNVVGPPGSILQTVEATPYAANTNITTVIPSDDTIPQIGEGTQILTLAITPLFADSKIRLWFQGTFSINAVSSGIAALFRSPVTNAIKATNQTVSAANQINNLALQFSDSPATTSAVTYTIRTGPGSASTMRYNGTPSARFFGGAQAATLVAQEIKV